MLLADDGAIALTDDIRQHLPELKEYGKKISINSILGHFSGLGDFEDLLNQSGMAQKMIVIGITNTERTRDFTPTYDESYNQWGISGGADNFLDFLEKELKPYVKANYSTNNYAIISGHSLPE